MYNTLTLSSFWEWPEASWSRFEESHRGTMLTDISLSQRWDEATEKRQLQNGSAWLSVFSWAKTKARIRQNRAEFFTNAPSTTLPGPVWLLLVLRRSTSKAFLQARIYSKSEAAKLSHQSHARQSSTQKRRHHLAWRAIPTLHQPSKIPKRGEEAAEADLGQGACRGH